MLDFVRNVYDSEDTPKGGGAFGTAAVFKNDFASGPMVLVSKQGSKWSLPTEAIPRGEKTKDAIIRFMMDKFRIDCGELKFIKKKGLTRSQRRPGTVGGAEFVFGAVLSHAGDHEVNDCKWVPVSKIPRLSFGHASVAKAAANKLLGISEGTMIHQKLQTVYEALDAWFATNGVEYDIVADEDDLQGYVVPKRYESLTPRIMRFLESACADNDLHCRSQHTRSGLVLALSLQAIAESTMSAMVADHPAGAPTSRFSRRLDLVFGGKPPTMSESPFHTATRRRQRQTPQQSVNEGLKGVAAHYQPVDILKRVEKAMVDLGLVDALKAAGITNRLSSDKQVLRFFITDAEGRAREILAYDLVKLGEANEFERALKALRDLAHNRSPGSSDREMERIRDQETIVKDTAKKYTPQKPEEGPTKPLMAGSPMESRAIGDLIDRLLIQ